MAEPFKTHFIVLYFEDETIGVMQFIESVVSGDRVFAVANPTERNIQQEIDRSGFEKKVVGWKKVLPHELPTDRTYREAWRHNEEDGFYHDMEHARALHLDKVRQARNKRLAELDIAYMLAMESEDKAAMKFIANTKQYLRDLPATIGVEKVTSIDELKLLWDKELV